MCGIAGFYRVKVSQGTIHDVVSALRHRGPDGQAVYTHEDVALIHTRLSIIELSDLGAQPYYFENLVLVYNGEIYNYKEVREELKNAGYLFESNADTEVLIKAFHYWKEKCVERFIGMFAFAVYDQLTDELWLFRDRIGVKPLYYQLDNKTLIFASELKALKTLINTKEIDRDAAYFYFRFGFTPKSKSIFKSVHKLPAGHYLKMTKSGSELKQYWRPEFNIDHSKTETQWVDELEALMTSAFKYRMVSDVPVGVFLSGGIDSSLVAAVLQKYYGNINSFTIGFRESAFDESVYAQRVADHLKINHTHKTLGLDEARELLKNFYSIYDEPFADTSGIPTACVTQLAKENGMKVVLSADGGDELFAGYSHYEKAFRLFQQLKNIPSSLRSVLAGISGGVAPKTIREKVFSFNLEHKLYALEELMKVRDATSFFEAYQANQSVDEVLNLMGNHTSENYLERFDGEHHPIEKMMKWDLQHYLVDDLLVKVDRATMYYGLECREPLLDHRLIEMSMRMPLDMKLRGGKTKYIVRKLLGRYVPESFFERKKQGFSIPIFEWFSSDLDAMFKTHFDPDRIGQIPLLNKGEVLNEYAKYRKYKSQGKPYNIEKMWRILSFMLWHEKYVRQ